MRVLKLLLTCTSRSWGGMEMQALRTALALGRAGEGRLELDLLCAPGSALCREAERAGVRVLPMAFGGGLHLGLILALRRELASGGYDLVHAHFSRDLRFIVPAAEGLRPRRPIVLTKHVGSYIRKQDLLHRYLYSRVDLVTAISRVIRDNVIATCPVEPSRVEVIHNGVDLGRFRPSAEARRRARAEFGFAEDEVVVGMVGRMSPGKGHEEFLRAARELTDGGERARFVVVGGASFGEEGYAASVERLARELRLASESAPAREPAPAAAPGGTGGVIFTGFREDVPELLAAMDILAFPSHAEAFGNVAIEAMAAALPVVSTNCDGVLDIVAEGVTGFQVPPRDAPALAAALRRLVRDPALRRRLGEAGRLRAEEHFDEEKQTRALLGRYERLTGRSLLDEDAARLR